MSKIITFSTVKEVVLNAVRRLLKIQQFGTKTATQVSSFGDDSCPLNDMIAIYANTSNISDNIIIGYINANQIAEIGEKRLFSLKSDGSLSFAIHLKNDGTCEVGGNDNFMVRFNELKDGYDDLKSKVNEIVQAYNTHSHGGNGSLPPANQLTQTNASIDNAKIEHIKTS